MRINVNNLYIASLHMLEYYCYNHTAFYSSKVRNVVVYRDVFGKYFDFSTGKRYKTNIDINRYFDRRGLIFVNLNDPLIPLTRVMSFEKDKIDKSKILKKVNNVLK